MNEFPPIKALLLVGTNNVSARVFTVFLLTLFFDLVPE